jgi:hypothetical protein
LIFIVCVLLFLIILRFGFTIAQNMGIVYHI